MSFKQSKQLLANLGYEKELYKINLIDGNGQYTDDFESGVVDDIIFYNTIDIDSNTRSILEFNYQDYTTIKTGLIG